MECCGKAALEGLGRGVARAPGRPPNLTTWVLLQGPYGGRRKQCPSCPLPIICVWACVHIHALTEYMTTLNIKIKCKRMDLEAGHG